MYSEVTGGSRALAPTFLITSAIPSTVSTSGGANASDQQGGGKGPRAAS